MFPFDRTSKTGKAALGAAAVATLACSLSSAEATPLPPPQFDEPLATSAPASPVSVVLAGGCFWGIQAVFQHIKGVSEAISGYAGGAASTAQYELVGSGTTGHAETVKVTYDPTRVTLGTLLQVFFAVAHNPTELNRQGPDHGSQYRSAVFVATPEQRHIAEAYIAQLNAAKAFTDPVVTKVEALQGFYPAESYHQNYARIHPENLYIVVNDLPKVAALAKAFPQLYTTAP